MKREVYNEIEFLREQVRFLRRTIAAMQRQVDVCETRIDDLRRERDKEVEA